MRCVNADGSMAGIMKTSDALALATKQNLDLVEVSPSARPPVCRIMDYGKYQYEVNRKMRSQRKAQHNQIVKEVKFHANVEEHDYQTKLNHIRGFLEKGHKIKLSLMFRGRENAHRELGFDLINRVIKETDEVAQVDMTPRMLGRSIVALMSARSKKK